MLGRSDHNVGNYDCGGPTEEERRKACKAPQIWRPSSYTLMRTSDVSATRN